MPQPLPSAPPIDAAVNIGSLRTIGKGSHQAISGPLTFGTVEFVSGSYPVVATDRYIQVRTPGVTITLLPISNYLDAETIIIQDTTGAIASSPVSVDPNGDNINGATDPFNFNVDFGTLLLRRTSTGWWTQVVSAADVLTIPSYATGVLPTPDGSVRIAKLTNSYRGLTYSNGSAWNPIYGSAVYTLEQFGGKADGTTDNLAAWNAIFADFGATLGAQIVLGPGVYLFSDTPHVTRVCKIVGAGGNFLNPLTIVRVPDGKDGMKFDYADGPSGTAAYTTVDGICIEGLGPARHWQALTSYSIGNVIEPSYWGGLAWVCTGITTGISGASEPAFTVRLDNLPDTDGDVIVDAGVTWTSKVIAGFRIGAGVFFTNCQARYFTGDGFHVMAISDSANDATMLNCFSSNNFGNGYYWANANANAWAVINCYAIENGMWGFRDRSFLGTHFFGPNTAANGYNAWLPSTLAGDFAGFNGVQGLVGPTNYGTGFVYLADDLSHTTGTTEPIWPLTIGGTVADGTVVWTAIAHWTGGRIQVTNLNAYTTISGPYDELGGLPMDLISNACTVTGGLGAIAKPVKATILNFGGSSNNINIDVSNPGLGEVTFQLGSDNPGTQLRLFGYRAYDNAGVEVVDSSFDFAYWKSGYFAGAYALTHLYAAPGDTPYTIATGASPYQPAGSFSFPNGFWWYGGAVTLNTYGSLAPTSGTWRKGDWVQNNANSGTLNAGDPLGWRCVTAGTPGTWEELYAGPEHKLSTISVDMSLSTKQALYTVPAGRTLVITKLILRGATAAFAAGSLGFGFDASAVNVLASSTYTGLAGATDAVILTPTSSPTTAFTLGAAADVFGAKTTVTQATTLVTVDVFGYLI